PSALPSRETLASSSTAAAVLLTIAVRRTQDLCLFVVLQPLSSFANRQLLRRRRAPTPHPAQSRFPRHPSSCSSVAPEVIVISEHANSFYAKSNWGFCYILCCIAMNLHYIRYAILCSSTCITSLFVDNGILKQNPCFLAQQLDHFFDLKSHPRSSSCFFAWLWISYVAATLCEFSMCIERLTGWQIVLLVLVILQSSYGGFRCVECVCNQMVYITSWDEFVERSVQLFRADPDATRYVMKYRHCDGKLVLKVTDNRECLKYKTDQAQEAKKMEKLNNIFFTLMARGPEVDLSEVTGKEQTDAQPTKRGRGRKQ
ncbi:hypothetical protein HN51_021520, partial [Arachis hypogaea]